MLMGLDKGGKIKSYLFGLGAMLVSAGLMFVLMHGEVSAEIEGGGKVDCDAFYVDEEAEDYVEQGLYVYCKIKDLTCVSTIKGISCVRGSIF